MRRIYATSTMAGLPVPPTTNTNLLRSETKMFSGFFSMVLYLEQLQNISPPEEAGDQILHPGMSYFKEALCHALANVYKVLSPILGGGWGNPD
jgi:hypothetical protein